MSCIICGHPVQARNDVYFEYLNTKGKINRLDIHNSCCHLIDNTLSYLDFSNCIICNAKVNTNVSCVRLKHTLLGSRPVHENCFNFKSGLNLDFFEIDNLSDP